MSDNPYAVSAERVPSLENDELGDLGVVGADDGLVFVKASASLPQRCIRTNAEEDLVEVFTMLGYIPSEWLVSFPFTGLLSLPLLFFARKHIGLTYWISRREQSRRWFLSAACVATMFFGPILALHQGTFAVAVAFTWAGCVGLFLLNRLLRVVSHEDGVFKIKGCSEAFLRSLQPDIADG